MNVGLRFARMFTVLECLDQRLHLMTKVIGNQSIQFGDLTISIWSVGWSHRRPPVYRYNLLLAQYRSLHNYVAFRIERCKGAIQAQTQHEILPTETKVLLYCSGAIRITVTANRYPSSLTLNATWVCYVDSFSFDGDELIMGTTSNYWQKNTQNTIFLKFCSVRDNNSTVWCLSFERIPASSAAKSFQACENSTVREGSLIRRK